MVSTRVETWARRRRKDLARDRDLGEVASRGSAVGSAVKGAEVGGVDDAGADALLQLL